ncbi:type I-F CRISPR-associated endoribonuclease Cas6/Csy4 [Orbaceae bacterium ac157xtp]
MLTHYIEINLVPQLELREHEVANHVMQQLHRCFVNYHGEIGVSFPDCEKKYSAPFGKIRLFGKENSLSQLYSDLINVSDITNYAIISNVMPVPTHDGYLIVNRVRHKGPSALRRAEKRLKAQGKWSAEVEKNMRQKWDIAALKGKPHFNLKSSSTGQDLTLWIKQKPCDKQVLGKFNSYGLSDEATVPNF